MPGVLGSAGDAMAAYRRSRLDRGRWVATVGAAAFAVAAVVLVVAGSLVGLVLLVPAAYAGAAAWVGFQVRRARR